MVWTSDGCGRYAKPFCKGRQERRSKVGSDLRGALPDESRAFDPKADGDNPEVPVLPSNRLIVDANISR
jgi:hypothetical protein